MLRNGAAGKNAGMDLRVQCFDSSVKHFREAGVIGNLLYGNACLSDEFCGAPGRQNVVTEFRQAFANSTTPDLSEQLISACFFMLCISLETSVEIKV